MQRLFRLWKGFLKISVQGSFLQRFLNLCRANQIRLNNIGFDYEGLTAEIRVKDFYRLKPILKKAKCKVVLLEKRGLPFLLYKMRLRKGFLLGFCLAAIMFFMMSQMIWNIELVGFQTIPSKQFMSFLMEQGIGYGCFKRTINTKRIQESIRNEYPPVVWAGVVIDGTKLRIEVKEKDRKQNVTVTYTDEKACHLIASADGVVAKMVTRRGIPMVKAGDAVKKGDILVNGMIPICNDDETVREVSLVKADADIYLKTQFHYKNQLNFQYRKKKYTGQKQTVYFVKVFKRNFCLQKRRELKSFDTHCDFKQLNLFHKLILPVYAGRIEYREYETENTTYSEKELKQILQNEFLNFCESLEKKGIHIQQKDVTIKQNRRTMYFDAELTVELMDKEEKEIVGAQKIE